MTRLQDRRKRERIGHGCRNSYAIEGADPAGLIRAGRTDASALVQVGDRGDWGKAWDLESEMRRLPGSLALPPLLAFPFLITTFFLFDLPAKREEYSALTVELLSALSQHPADALHGLRALPSPYCVLLRHRSAQHAGHMMKSVDANHMQDLLALPVAVPVLDQHPHPFKWRVPYHRSW